MYEYCGNGGQSHTAVIRVTIGYLIAMCDYKLINTLYIMYSIVIAIINDMTFVCVYTCSGRLTSDPWPHPGLIWLYITYMIYSLTL